MFPPPLHREAPAGELRLWFGMSGMPRLSEETVERIIHSDPFAHWWHQRPLG
jgi:hypothetical protein